MLTCLYPATDGARTQPQSCGNVLRRHRCGGVVAVKFLHLHAQSHAPSTTGKIGNSALIVTVNAHGRLMAQGTVGGWLSGLEMERNKFIFTFSRYQNKVFRHPQESHQVHVLPLFSPRTFLRKTKSEACREIKN